MNSIKRASPLYFLAACALAVSPLVASTKVTDISNLDSVQVASIFTPYSVAHLKKRLPSLKKPISIAGARCSQGLHIAIRNGTMVDLKELKKIVAFDKQKKQITVEAGITWRDIQKYIDRYDLALAAIQSYSDFSVGGSLSVNVHGRDIQHGSLITMVDSIDMLLASGDIVHASRTENADLFFSSIGGYGALGIIVHATINLVPNCALKRKVQTIPLADYKRHYFQSVITNPKIQLHNANIMLGDFDSVASVSWCTTDRPVTVQDRLRTTQKFYPVNMAGEALLRKNKIGHHVREKVEMKEAETPLIVWRNYEMGHTINTLKPVSRIISSSILQEYFIPVDQFETFAKQLKKIIKSDGIDMLNVSIRHVPADKGTTLPYAPQESFAFVCYLNIFNNSISQNRAKAWTQKLINAALACGGTYYLPYQPWATREQFMQAYPGCTMLREHKKKYDPTNTFNSNFIQRYIL